MSSGCYFTEDPLNANCCHFLLRHNGGPVYSPSTAMTPIEATQEWKSTCQGSLIGLLEVGGVDNRAASPALEERKKLVVQNLRDRYKGHGRKEFVAAPVLSDYVRYYKRFDKTYHVLLQLESIVLKGKGLPKVSPLVDANFAAELETLVLTAGHDSEKLAAPAVIDVSRAGDTMTQMNGAAKALPPGDMVMRDAGGVACSILHGQDNRSPISSATTRALYVAYAPPGVAEEAVRDQLEGILANVRLFAPGCKVERLEVFGAL
jgi:DNA/RNA-binding domain of Phe-tRNA-synthetase-like protein